jgi:hypothetical protein
MAKKKPIVHNNGAHADRKHQVSCTLHVPELTKTGSALRLEVSDENGKLGTIEIGQGSLGWIPKKKSRRNVIHISWSDFAKNIHLLSTL